MADHPIHANHREARNRYSDTIKWAKVEHWKAFLEAAQGPNIWMANHYISNPISDGGIPTLKVMQPDNATTKVSTNEDKVATFH